MTVPNRAGFTVANLMSLEFTVQQMDELSLPEHSGSMLRGAFGTALRSLTCVTKLPDCKACPLKSFCRFPHIFETPALTDSKQQVVNPYVIHLPTTPQGKYRQGETWRFGMSILGDAIKDTALIVTAWQQALQLGLGTHAPYRRAHLLQVRCGDMLIFDAAKDKQAAMMLPKDFSTQIALLDKAAKPNAPVNALELRFLTPFRHQQDGKIAARSQSLDVTTFLASLYNRLARCQRDHRLDAAWDLGFADYHNFKAAIRCLDIQTNLETASIHRRSNRQGRKMQLLGLQGSIYLTDKDDSGALLRLLPALRLGEILHIGKNTTMGWGQYRLSPHTKSQS